MPSYLGLESALNPGNAEHLRRFYRTAIVENHRRTDPTIGAHLRLHAHPQGTASRAIKDGTRELI